MLQSTAFLNKIGIKKSTMFIVIGLKKSYNKSNINSAGISARDIICHKHAQKEIT